MSQAEEASDTYGVAGSVPGTELLKRDLLRLCLEREDMRGVQMVILFFVFMSFVILLLITSLWET